MQDDLFEKLIVLYNNYTTVLSTPLNLIQQSISVININLNETLVLNARNADTRLFCSCLKPD